MQGGEVARELQRERRNVWSRAELAQDPDFIAYSPRPGTLELPAFRAALTARPERTFAMLPRLAKAADAPLQRAARRIASRIILRDARSLAGSTYGGGRLAREPLGPDGDLDLDGSLDAVFLARAGRTAVAPDLFAQVWRRPRTSVCLIVDTSGSMSGAGIATAALAAAAIALRARTDFSVVVVRDRALILRDHGSNRSIEAVIDDLLTLRSYGWTNLGAGLCAARAQLARAVGSHRIAILLSDGDSNRGADPLPLARRLETLHVVSTAGTGSACRALASAGHGRAVCIEAPHDIVPALGALLAGG